MSDAAKISELTAPGWPRPWAADVDGVRHPAPWVTEIPNFAAMNHDRREQMVTDLLCQICGEGHPPGAEVVVFQTGRLRDKATGGELQLSPRSERHENAAVFASVAIGCRDGAILHDRCARLAVKHCPALRRYRELGQLFGFRGPLAAITVIEDADDDADGTPVDLLLLDGASAQIWNP